MNYKVIAVVVALLVGLGLYGRHHHVPPPKPNPNAVCHVKYEGTNALPDPNCTPGTLNSGVTQANIKQTICVKGWTATIRLPQSYTYPLKVQSIKSYGYADTNLAHYEEDHFIPLELGGNPTDVKNLWAEPGASPNAKDGVEGSLRQRVCDGSLPLAVAQQKVTTDWTTALK